jgi:hypothetical protein
MMKASNDLRLMLSRRARQQAYWNRGKGTLLIGEGRGSVCAMNHLRDATLGSTLLDATMGSPLLDATMGSQFHGYRLIRSPAFRFIFMHWFRTGILTAHPVFDGE